jgi:hypothetical protein
VCLSALACRRSGSQCGRIRALDGEEQLYATTTILPYASFTELDLRGLQLPSNDAWCALLAACSRCSNLRAVNVSDCSLGRFGASPPTGSRVWCALHCPHGG